MNKKISIELPFFPGFYETIYFNSDTDYYAIEEELEYYQESEENPNLTADDLDFDYEEYTNDVTNAFVLAWKANAPKSVVENVEFEELDSPRYYNYRNDKIYATVTLTENWEEEMRKFMEENKEWLKERIKKDWTSYDGFMSFMENDYDKWVGELFEEQDERYIGTMIGYMMYKEDKDIINTLYYDTMDDIYAGSYVYLINEKDEEQES